jgi:thiol-disulfide isomerase/thioredoxin
LRQPVPLAYRADMRRLPIALLLAPLLLAGCEKREPAANEAAAIPGVPTKGVDRSHKGQPAPDVAFNGPDGEEITLAEFRGEPVLVNLWATWCAPCVKELPTLDPIADARRKGEQINVIAVSQDMGPQASIKAFLNTHKIFALEAYHDPKMALSGALNAQVLPTTILYDAQGREVWRYVGDLDWTGPEAARLLADIQSAAPAG